MPRSLKLGLEGVALIARAVAAIPGDVVDVVLGPAEPMDGYDPERLRPSCGHEMVTHSNTSLRVRERECVR